MFLRRQGFDLVKYEGTYQNIPVELSELELEIVKFVFDGKLSMTSVSRLVATLKACKYVVENNIPGDFVECGVWRGGHGIIAKKIFEHMGSDKRVILFDTFAGMTEPSEFDISPVSKQNAKNEYLANQRATHNEWCYASVSDVRKNFENAKVDISGVHFVVGDVCKTLDIDGNIPSLISVLRLDTDWYDSTRKELQTLYPVISDRGVLIVDDYGDWEGARRAVEEFFETTVYKPLFNATDYTGRLALKLGS